MIIKFEFRNTCPKFIIECFFNMKKFVEYKTATSDVFFQKNLLAPYLGKFGTYCLESSLLDMT